jgi:hypothetical protein
MPESAQKRTPVESKKMRKEKKKKQEKKRKEKRKNAQTSPSSPVMAHERLPHDGPFAIQARDKKKTKNKKTKKQSKNKKTAKP